MTATDPVARARRTDAAAALTAALAALAVAETKEKAHPCSVCSAVTIAACDEVLRLRALVLVNAATEATPMRSDLRDEALMDLSIADLPLGASG